MTNKSALYIVATPIGNLADITQRAIDVLRTVSIIAAEDTRHSSKLLSHLGVQTPLVSYHDHGGRGQVERVIARLERGESVALISDAGTPLISDPGYRLVHEARQKGLRVVPVPGACALVAALSCSGLACDRFIFEGFLPAKTVARKKLLDSLSSLSSTLVFYESTHRIIDSLEDMVEVLGAARLCCIAREITKAYETFLAGSLELVSQQVAADLNQQKGEFVVMVEGVKAADATAEVSEEGRRILKVLLQDLPLKQAATLTSKITGEKKNKLYQWALVQAE